MTACSDQKVVGAIIVGTIGQACLLKRFIRISIQSQPPVPNLVPWDFAPPDCQEPIPVGIGAKKYEAVSQNRCP